MVWDRKVPMWTLRCFAGLGQSSTTDAANIIISYCICSDLFTPVSCPGCTYYWRKTSAKYWPIKNMWDRFVSGALSLFGLGCECTGERTTRIVIFGGGHGPCWKQWQALSAERNTLLLLPAISIPRTSWQWCDGQTIKTPTPFLLILVLSTVMHRSIM
jgi:hypothetical protein